MAELARRSARTRKANPKYASQSWDKETLQLLHGSDSESSAESTSSRSEEAADLPGSVEQAVPQASPDRSDDDFRDENEVSSSSSVSLASTPKSVTAEMEGSNPPTPEADDDMADVDAESASVGEQETKESEVHSRGLQSFRNRGGPKSGTQALIFGPEINDLYPVLETRDCWLGRYDITFPSRTSLSGWISRVERAQRHPQISGLTYSLTHDRLDMPMLAILREMQFETELDLKDRHLYLPQINGDASAHTIIAGPSNRQSSHLILPYQSLKLGVGFDEDRRSNAMENSEHDAIQDIEMGDDDRLDDPSARPNSPANQQNTETFQGWLINAGEKITALAWHPDARDSQLLAVATRCTSSQREIASESGENGPPAFSKSAAYPASIQLWRFPTQGSVASLRKLDMASPAEMVQVICINHGQVRQLEWLPTNTGQTAVDESGAGNEFMIGWLAALFSDGAIRMYFVRCAEDAAITEPHFFQVYNPALIIMPPPGTMFSTFTFISNRDVLTGTAAGSACIYDLSNIESSGRISEPSIVYELHNTYIMSIRSAATSGLPYMIISTSASGEIVLMDLRAPDQDVLRMHKARLPSKNLVYAPFTRTILTTVNKTGNTDAKASTSTVLLSHSLRHFYIANAIAYLPDLSGSGTALAASKWHPCIIVGNARGSVFATNYVRRLIPTGRSGHISSPDGWLQKLCDYDWRPLVDTNGQGGKPDSRTVTDLYHGQDVRPGMSRFQEGFKPEKIDVSRDDVRKKKKKGGEDVGAEVVFEEEQAVSVIEWNPNPHCAGVVAIGWNSGILRVQDVAHDAQ